MGFGASEINSTPSADGRNSTQSVGNKSGKDGGDVYVPALIGVIVQTISIILAVSLIAVAAIHKAKFRRLLLAWLGWTTASLLIAVVLMIVGIVAAKYTFVDIAISVVSICYMVISFWLVLSYYNFFAGSVEHQVV